MGAPQNYGQWISCLDRLSGQTVTDDFIQELKGGSCPGIETVSAAFQNRVQDTVNAMLNRITKSCTRLLNESLADNDLSNVEIILRRHFRELLGCRFFLQISFLPNDFKRELDERTVEEIRRFWKLMKNYFEEIAEESHSEEVYDLVYYINRLISKDLNSIGNH